jgi:hypothetical protein
MTPPSFITGLQNVIINTNSVNRVTLAGNNIVFQFLDGAQQVDTYVELSEAKAVYDNLVAILVEGQSKYFTLTPIVGYTDGNQTDTIWVSHGFTFEVGGTVYVDGVLVVGGNPLTETQFPAWPDQSQIGVSIPSSTVPHTYSLRYVSPDSSIDITMAGSFTRVALPTNLQFTAGVTDDPPGAPVDTLQPAFYVGNNRTFYTWDNVNMVWIGLITVS